MYDLLERQESYEDDSIPFSQQHSAKFIKDFHHQRVRDSKTDSFKTSDGDYLSGYDVVIHCDGNKSTESTLLSVEDRLGYNNYFIEKMYDDEYKHNLDWYLTTILKFTTPIKHKIQYLCNILFNTFVSVEFGCDRIGFLDDNMKLDDEKYTFTNDEDVELLAIKIISPIPLPEDAIDRIQNICGIYGIGIFLEVSDEKV